MRNSKTFIGVGRFCLILMGFTMSACDVLPQTSIPAQIPLSTWTVTLTSTTTPIVFTDTPVPAFTETPSPSPTTSSTPTYTVTPDPYNRYTIEYLISRQYGGGELEITETYGESAAFTRYFMRYPSDSLSIYGFMNVPKGEGPFPVIIALHGYIDPTQYYTLDYTTHYADALAEAGYLVVHPNLRNYLPSDQGENLYRVGMAIDVLNLITILQQQGGQPGPLAIADPTRIGLWGHSMGGGISTRVITVSDDVDATVLYGAMSGDELQNFEAILEWSEGERGEEELSSPEGVLRRISPINYLDRISSAVSIHHGQKDELVPLEWSQETCEMLIALEKEVECFYYENMPHTFYGEGDQDFIENTITFFDRVLRSDDF